MKCYPNISTSWLLQFLNPQMHELFFLKHKIVKEMSRIVVIFNKNYNDDK